MASLNFSCEDVEEWMKKEGFQAFGDHFYGKKIASKFPNGKFSFGAKKQSTLTFLFRIILRPESLALQTLIFLS